MAIRRPDFYQKGRWVFQDQFFFSDPPRELRYVVSKVDSFPYETYSETYDYLQPTRSGGNVVARIDYTLEGKLITIDHWENFWKDEFALRGLSNYLVNCLYPSSLGFSVRVSKEAPAFWVSEGFEPLSNLPDDFLVR